MSRSELSAGENIGVGDVWGEISRRNGWMGAVRVGTLYNDMKLPTHFFLKYFDKDWDQWVDISGNFKLEGKIKIEIGEDLQNISEYCDVVLIVRLKRGLGHVPARTLQVDHQQERKKKSVVKVQVGWSNYRNKTRSYSQVKSNSGGGVVSLQVARDVHYTELKNKAIDTFFPSGNSKFFGSKEAFHFFLGNNRGQAYESDRFNVDELFQEAGSKARVYLYSKLKSYDPIELTSSDEESLPEIRLAGNSDASLMETKVERESKLAAVLSKHEPSVLSLNVMPSTVHANVSTPQPEEPVTIPLLPSTATASTSQEPAVTAISLLSAATTAINAGSTPCQETATTSSGTPTVSFKASSGICEICADRPKDCFFIPCGHTLCMPCAVHLESEGCPYCKGVVEKIGSLFP
ncbi:hypothetical protein HOLleu_43026 [Holothuria leucospilota]|uniref:RING-type domain-containing protein n=1 Tax=Holothuria leucospilota TaxID=206669 RepID=A0A9Q0YC64_HOLLE|nr:hypothetical protein HOLleu_43026 [Holothuria leucospilota]